MRCELAQYETGGAWLSSARVVRCWVKSRNERNPYRPLLTRKGEDSDETAGDNSEEGGDDVNHHAPYDLGYTRATMGTTKRSETARWSKTQKSTLSSDCGLQPAHMKLELLVIADQHAAVNTFPGLVHTARHTMGVGSARSQ